MRILLTIITAFLLLGATNCIAQDSKLPLLWQKGNDYYAQKTYDSAAYYFEQIAVLKPIKADVYYNLGNTYYRLNKIGQAVLNYERALKIAPDNKEAKDNLMLTQNRISNHILPVADIFFIQWWQSLTQPIKATKWAVCALFIFIIAIAILVLKQFYKPIGNKLPIQSLYILSLLWLWFLIIAIVASNNGVKTTGGVVMQNDSPLMSNDLKGKPITQIPEGTTVSIIDEKDMWIQIRLPDGRIGWIQQSLVEKI